MNLARLFSLLVAAQVVSTLVSASSIASENPRDCQELASARKLLSEKSALLASSEVSRIDVAAEYSAFNLAALKLRTLARFDRCHLHLAEKDESYSVRADDGTIDDFDVSGVAREVITWKHLRAGSELQEAHFSSRGEIDFTP